MFMKDAIIRRTGDFEFEIAIGSHETVRGIIRQRGESFLSAVFGLIVLLTSGAAMVCLAMGIGLLLAGISPFDIDRSPLWLMGVLIVGIIIGAFATSTAITAMVDPKRFRISLEDQGRIEWMVRAKPVLKPDIANYSAEHAGSGDRLFICRQYNKDVTTVFQPDGSVYLVDTPADIEPMVLSHELEFDGNVRRTNIVVQFILRIPSIVFALLSPVRVVRRESGVHPSRVVWLAQDGAFVPLAKLQRTLESDLCTEVKLVVSDPEQTTSKFAMIALMCTNLF